MSHRIERVNSLIRQEISDLLQRQVNDPRLVSLITVTAVSTSTDLKHARVFISSIGSDSDKEEKLKGLVSASGFFRRELGRRIKLRYIPELSFEWDDSIERGDHILQLIDKVTSKKTAY